MTFKHVKAVGNKYYLYEVTSIWDPEKKSPRQKRKYLGCCDAEGNLIPSSRGLHAPNVSKTFGTIWLINEIANNLRIRDKIRNITGDEIADVLMASIYQNAIRPVPFERLSDVADESMISDLFGSDLKMPERSVTDIQSIRSSFIYSMCKESVRTVAFVSEGYWAIYSPDTGALLGCGSIKYDFDVQDIIELATKYVPSASGCVFVFDEESYSKKFVTALYQNGIEFVIPVPSNRKSYRSVISDCLGSMGSIADSVSGGEIRREVGDADVRAISIYNEALHDRACDDFMDSISSLQTTIEGMNWSKGLRGVLRDCYGDVTNCLDIRKGPNGSVEVSIIQQAVTDFTDYMGRLVLVTDSSRPLEEVYMMYRGSYGIFPRKQDCVETSFQSMSGMIASMICNDIVKRMCSSELSKNMDYDDVINELSKLKASRFGAEWVLNDITDKQRGIFDSLGVPIPTNESIRSMIASNQ